MQSLPPCSTLDLGPEHHTILKSICKEAAKRKDLVDRRPSQEVANRHGITGDLFRDLIADLVHWGAIQTLEYAADNTTRKARRPLVWCSGHFSYSSDNSDVISPSGSSLDFSPEGGVARSAATSVAVEVARSATPEAARSAAEVLEASNPAEALVGPEARSLSAVRAILKGPRLTKARGRPVDPDSPGGLTFYFVAAVDNSPAFYGIGAHVNRDALYGNFDEWLKQGLPPGYIRAMVDEFMKHPNWSKGKPAWKVFLAKRNALFARLERMVEEAERKDRHDDDYWLGTNDPGPVYPDTDEYWLGRSK